MGVEVYTESASGCGKREAERKEEGAKERNAFGWKRVEANRKCLDSFLWKGGVW